MSHPIEEETNIQNGRLRKERAAQTSVTCLLAVIVGVLLYRSTERPQLPEAHIASTPVMAPQATATSAEPALAGYPFGPRVAETAKAPRLSHDELVKEKISKQVGLMEWDRIFARISELEPSRREEILKEIAREYGLPSASTPMQIRKAVSSLRAPHTLTQSISPRATIMPMTIAPSVE